MKIQIVSDLGPPILGGAETYVSSLGKELNTLGNEVYWNHMRVSPSTYYGKIDGVSCYRSWVPFAQTNINFARLLYPMFMLPKVLNISRNSDIIQFNSFPAATTGWIAGKISRKPYLMMVHEFFRHLWNTVGRNFIERKLYPEIEKLIARSPYPQIICPSEYTKKTLMDVGIEGKIIDIIHHGIDHSIFHTGYEPLIKKEFGNRPIIGWAGRIGLSVTKNLTTLLAAFKIVKEQIPDSILVFQGSNFDYLIPAIKKIGLELDKEVVYKGEISRENLPYFYSSCDVFAMPSLSEGFGFSALEAQACGTPVVCFEKGALPEIVRDGQTGIKMRDANSQSLADGIIKVLNDENLKNKLQKNGPQWAKNFTWQKSANKHLEVYKKCL